MIFAVLFVICLCIILFVWSACIVVGRIEDVEREVNRLKLEKENDWK